MNVEHYMTKEVITVDPKTRVTEAVDLMEHHNFHSLPVVEKGRYIGLVTEAIIQQQTSSAATSLSIYELNYLLDKTTVEQIMDKNALFTSKEALVEEAADLMVENNITVLPILDEEKRVEGIITYKDIFRALIELSGYKDEGDRLIVEIEEDKVGVLNNLTYLLAEEGISISHIFVNNIEGKIEITVQINERVGDSARKILKANGYTVRMVN